MKEIIMTKTTPAPASRSRAADKPADVKATAAVIDTQTAADTPTPATGTATFGMDGTDNATKTADEKKALEDAAEKGASTPPGSEDKQAKGIAPAADPAQRIDEMTNDEAKAFSAAQNSGQALHTADEDRPRGKAHIDASTGNRTAEGEANWQSHYTQGWNDFNEGKARKAGYSGTTTEDKDAYMSGWNGAERESKLGHQGGDMKRGDFEKARVSGTTT